MFPSGVRGDLGDGVLSEANAIAYIKDATKPDDDKLQIYAQLNVNVIEKSKSFQHCTAGTTGALLEDSRILWLRTVSSEAMGVSCTHLEASRQKLVRCNARIVNIIVMLIMIYVLRIS